MPITRNRNIAKAIGQAVRTGSITSDGAVSGGGGVTIYEYADAATFYANVDSAGLTDGSLHYNTTTRDLYVWDDSDGQFFPVTLNEALNEFTGYVFGGETYGYTSGGNTPDNRIDRFSFASNGNAIDISDTLAGRHGHASHSSKTFAYIAGGWSPIINIIQKMPFSSEGNMTDIADLTQSRFYMASQSSKNYGYSAGGRSQPFVDTIDKHPFSADANATDVGNLSVARAGASASSSTTHGYAFGGFSPPVTATIDKFAFVSGGTASNIGSLTTACDNPAGQSSTSNGYRSGSMPPQGVNVIDKFPFSTDANASDVGDLTIGRGAAGGHQI